MRGRPPDDCSTYRSCRVPAQAGTRSLIDDGCCASTHPTWSPRAASRPSTTSMPPRPRIHQSVRSVPRGDGSAALTGAGGGSAAGGLAPAVRTFGPSPASASELIVATNSARLARSPQTGAGRESQRNNAKCKAAGGTYRLNVTVCSVATAQAISGTAGPPDPCSTIRRRKTGTAQVAAGPGLERAEQIARVIFRVNHRTGGHVLHAAHFEFEKLGQEVRRRGGVGGHPFRGLPAPIRSTESGCRNLPEDRSPPRTRPRCRREGWSHRSSA